MSFENIANYVKKAGGLNTSLVTDRLRTKQKQMGEYEKRVSNIIKAAEQLTKTIGGLGLDIKATSLFTSEQHKLDELPIGLPKIELSVILKKSLNKDELVELENKLKQNNIKVTTAHGDTLLLDLDYKV